MTCDDVTVLLVALTRGPVATITWLHGCDNLKWLHLNQSRGKAFYMNTGFKHQGNSSVKSKKGLNLNSLTIFFPFFTQLFHSFLCVFKTPETVWSPQEGSCGDTDLIHVKWRAGGLALALQVNFTFSWPACQFLSIPIIDTIGATVKQDNNKKKQYGIKNIDFFKFLLLLKVGCADKNVFYFCF